MNKKELLLKSSAEFNQGADAINTVQNNMITSKSHISKISSPLPTSVNSCKVFWGYGTSKTSSKYPQKEILTLELREKL